MAYTPKTWTNGVDVTNKTNMDHLETQYTEAKADMDAFLAGSTVITSTGAGIKDEDDMSSDSAVALATQQSIKAYVDTFWEMIADTNLTNLIHSNDTERTTIELSYTKIKEITLSRDMAGCTLQFHLECGPVGNIDVYAKVYKNGGAEGAERTTDLFAGANFAEDFTGWVSGDLIQIYAYTANAWSAAEVENMRIYALVGPKGTMGANNDP